MLWGLRGSRTNEGCGKSILEIMFGEGNLNGRQLVAEDLSSKCMVECLVE